MQRRSRRRGEEAECSSFEGLWNIQVEMPRSGSEAQERFGLLNQQQGQCSDYGIAEAEGGKSIPFGSLSSHIRWT